MEDAGSIPASSTNRALRNQGLVGGAEKAIDSVSWPRLLRVKCQHDVKHEANKVTANDDYSLKIA